MLAAGAYRDVHKRVTLVSDINATVAVLSLDQSKPLLAYWKIYFFHSSLNIVSKHAALDLQKLFRRTLNPVGHQSTN